MAVGTKVGAFAAFARIFLKALPHFDPVWNQVMAGFAIATMTYANIVALRQIQFKRLFAYSESLMLDFYLFLLWLVLQNQSSLLNFI